MISTTTDPVQIAIDTSDLAKVLVVDASDPLLDMMALSATSMVIEYLQSELIARSRTATYVEWPFSGTVTNPSISRQNIELDKVIRLPYANLIDVQSVEVYGKEEDFEIIDKKYGRIELDAPYPQVDTPAIKAEYTAGYGDDLTDVPEQIRNGIIMLAAFLYEHRGDCDAMDALKKSGAAQMLYPFKLEPVAL